MAVYITGDTHGDFRQIGDFCSVMGTKRDDVMIVLGDAGLNYFGDERDTARKTGVSRTRMTYLMIHGNHEMRPETLDGYRLIPWNGGMVYQEERFPNLLFAKDGEIYRLGGKDVAGRRRSLQRGQGIPSADGIPLVFGRTAFRRD